MFRVIRQLVSALRDPEAAAHVRFTVARRIARRVYPRYRFQWPQVAWWDDQEFNAYLARFNELDGFNTGRRWTMYQLLRLIAAVPGNTAECGVFQGAGSFLIANAGPDPRGQPRTHFIFDSFEGLSAPSAVDGSYWSAGNLACSLETVQSKLAALPHLRWHKGWIPQVFEGVERERFAFVHIDVDLHDPTRDSVAFFYPRMNAGGIIVCDDYGFTTCPGATKAIDEFLEDKAERMIALPFGGGLLIKGCKTGAPADLFPALSHGQKVPVAGAR
jgi:O-methyltransferase